MKLRSYQHRLQKMLPFLLLASALSIGLASCFLFYLSRNTAVPSAWGSDGGTRHDIAAWFNTAQMGLIVPLLAGSFGNLIRRQQVVPKIGQLFTALSFLSALLNFIQEYVVYNAFTRAEPLPGTSLAAWVNNFAWVFLLLLALYLLSIFPNGRFLSPNWRKIILTILFFFTLPLLIGSAIETPLSSAFQLPNLFISEQPEQIYNALFNVGITAMIVAVVTIVIAVLLRFRRSWARERQQMKWLLAGVVLMALFVVVGLTLTFDLALSFGAVLVNSAILGPLVGVGVALVRHQLYDIDIIIRRTLSYGALTALLGGTYFGSVVILQGLIQTVTGSPDSALITVISTLAIAALFNPLRHRVQSFMDRRFYRKKYNAQQILASFAQTARDEVALEQLSAELLGVVDKTLQPERISLWIK